jgi:polysaccharide pyruvyl transferase WcaK-like protein
MSLLFTGYYGEFNTGDDAFCVVADWAARKYWLESNIKFLGRNLPARLDDSKLKSCILQKKYIKGQYNLECLIQGTLNSKIVYAGGSVFHSEVKGISKENIFKHLHDHCNLQMGAVGVSLGPYANTKARNSIKDYLSRFSFLALRDSRSYEEAMEMDLSIPIVEAFDLAALLPLIYPISNNKTNESVIGISICNFESYVNGNLKKEANRFGKIIECIDLLSKRKPNIKIKLLVFNAHPELGDNLLSQKLISKVSSKANIELVNYNKNPYYMWKAVSECNVVLSTRLHAGIFACFSKTPFLQIEYHKKCTDFLNDIDYKDKYRIGDFEVSGEEACEMLLTLIDSHDILANNIESCQNKAILNFKHINTAFEKR